ncbi:uncharacterized protein [Pseudochaenichthys georgianus]|uniref:uncharacterized protein n=1 Tax=Pseudochaenichthys georgianus TaxID=52239 RepID=UPI00146C0F9F|nr:uncharacterized protein LOC117452287 [Pseudochaenichthys georgianus]XP_033946700.1 uncharacterized protein LOC117452287 [Pseudochaenichthys georgianus]
MASGLPSRMDLKAAASGGITNKSRCRDVSRDAQRPICSQESVAEAGHGCIEPAWRHRRVLLPCTFRDNSEEMHRPVQLQTPGKRRGRRSVVALSVGGTCRLLFVSFPRWPVVPASWRRSVFEAVHGLSHPGVKPSVRLVAAKFVWHGLKKDVRTWAGECVACQRAKVHRHTNAPLERFLVPERRFDHFNIDLVGPLPSSQGLSYLLTMVDRTTRWPEAVPLVSTSAADVARAFNVGVSFWHPVGHFLRHGPKVDLQCSTAEMVYGQPLRVPGDFLPKASAPWSATAQRAFLQDAAEAFAPIPTTQHGTKVSQVPAELRSAEHVFIRHDAHRGPLQPPYDGPFRVLEHGDKHLVVDLGGKAEHVSVDRVKAAHLDLDQPVVLARPPRRGRPPASSPVTDLRPVVPVPPLPGATQAEVTFPTPVLRSRGGRRVLPPRHADFVYV